MADEMMRAFAAFRRQLESHVSLTEAQIRTAWQTTLHLLQRDITIWTDKYSAKLKEVREESGNPMAQVSLSWLYDTYGGDWKHLQRSVTAQVGAFGEQSLQHILAGQGLAALLGSDAARELLISALRPVSHRVNPQQLIETTRNEARQALVGRSISGKHLPTLLKGLGEDAANRVHKGLLAALSTGENPRTAAGLLHHALGDSYNRALTVARTEMVGAYRDAQIMNYQRNSDVVGQWMWSAAKQGRTCFQCIWMDGTVHDLSETFDSHPCCRCSPVPVTKGWDEILGPLGIDSSDIPDTRATANYESGEDWFNRQSEQTQRHMLGPAAFSAWQEGDLKLGDLVGQHDDGQWYQKSLREIGINARDYLGARPERYVPEPEPEAVPVADTAAGDALRSEATQMRELFKDDYFRHSEDYEAQAATDAERQRTIVDAMGDSPEFQRYVEALGRQEFEFAGQTWTPEMQAVNSIESSWGALVMDDVPMNVALRETARDLFNLDIPERQIDSEIMAQAEKLKQDYGDMLRTFVQTTYDRTQAWFKEQGITELTVYRGLNSPAPMEGVTYDGTAGSVSVAGAAFSSYSIDPAMSYEYSSSATYRGGEYRALIAERVPVSEIFATALTSGMPDGAEGEVLVFGNARDANVLSFQPSEVPSLDAALNRIGARLGAKS